VATGAPVTTTVTHSYAPRGGCAEVFNYRGGEVLLSGPAGTGKSRACLEKLFACALANPGMRGLIVRKTAESLATTALVTWREHVAVEALAHGLVSFYGGSAVEAPQYRFSNGSTINVGGMNKSTRIMSSEYDVIYVQEAIELSVTDWEALTTRLRNGRMRFQQLIADTNPDAPTHWLNKRGNTGQCKVIESRHTDNPRLYDEDGHLTDAGRAYMALLDGLTGVRRARLLEGKWVGAVGQIYPEYDTAVHLIDAFPIPPDWRRWWAVDFGYRHPFVLQCWAEDGDGRLYRYRELFGTERTTDEWAQAALAEVRVHVDGDWPAPSGGAPVVPSAFELDGQPAVAPARTACDDPEHWKDWSAAHHYNWREPKPETIVCDHDAEARVVLERLLGLSTRPADKRVSVGIDAVKQRFKDRRVFLLRGALVSEDTNLADAHRPTCTEEEIPAYRWNDTKEAPVKIEDDGCDTMRYVIAHRDLAGQSNVRF